VARGALSCSRSVGCRLPNGGCCSNTPAMAETWFSEGVVDEIAIEGLELDCIVGVYDAERVSPQRVIVSARLAVDVERAASEEQLAATVDYEWVSMQIAFILKLGRFRLLETAAYSICRTLLLAPVAGEMRGAIHAIELTLRKPDALRGRGVPHVRMRRRANDLSSRLESKPFGSVDIIHETNDVGLYRLNVFPRRSIDLHIHRRMDEAELVLSTGLWCQGEPAERSSVRQWPHAVPHRYDNVTSEVQSLLCIDRPKFIELDEIPSEDPLGAVRAHSVWEL
jgi:dihydroneopterin aldolase